MNSVRQAFNLFSGHAFGLNGGKVVHVNGGLLNLRELVFKDLAGIDYAHRNYGATGLLGNLEASGVEFKKRVRTLVTRTFGEDADAGTFTHKVNTFVNHLKTAAKILSVKKDGGDVDAITASTITSRAYSLAVKNAVEAFKTIKGE